MNIYDFSPDSIGKKIRNAKKAAKFARLGNKVLGCLGFNGSERRQIVKEVYRAFKSTKE